METGLLRQDVGKHNRHAKKKELNYMGNPMNDDFYDKLGFAMGFLWWFR